MSLETLRTTESQVPWVHRGDTGALRGYFGTLWFVLWRPGRMVAEMARPVDFRDARSFWRVTWIVAGLAVLAAAVLGYVYRAVVLGEGHSLDLGLVLAGGVVALWGALGILPWLGACHLGKHELTEEQERRAIGLSYYLWAPLVFLWLGVGCGIGAVAVLGGDVLYVATLVLLAVVFTILPLLSGVVGVWRFVKRTAHPSWMALLWRTVRVGLLGLFILGLFALFPVSLFWLRLVYVSLR